MRNRNTQYGTSGRRTREEERLCPCGQPVARGEHTVGGVCLTCLQKLADEFWEVYNSGQ